MQIADKSRLSEKATSFGNVLYLEMPLVTGLAVHACWICLLFTDTLQNLHGPVAQRVAYGVFGVVFLAAFFAGGFVAGFDREHITKFIRRKWAHFLVSACGVAGCLLFVAVPSVPAALGIAGAASGAVLAGASGAFATVLWGEAARRRVFERLAMTSVLAFALAFLAALLVEYGLGTGAVDAALCLGPLASLVLVYKAQHDNVSYFKPQEFLVLPDGTKQVKEGAFWIETFHDLRISKARFALALGKSAVPFGVAFGSLAFETFRFLVSGVAEDGSVWAAMFPLCAVLLFVSLFFRTFPSAAHPSTSRRLFLFFFVFSLFACADEFSHGASSSGPSSVALLVLLGTMLWFYPAELTHRYRISAMLTFGYFAGFLALGVLAYAACSFLPFPAAPAALSACGRMAVLLLGFAFLMGDGKMRSIARVGGAPEERAAGTAEPRPRGTFTQRCQAVADTFLLSRRELEILIALAKGCNASHIQKELVISEGTVRTHMRNIYRKLNVHTQQELIDLVEDMPTERDAGR